MYPDFTIYHSEKLQIKKSLYNAQKISLVNLFRVRFDKFVSFLQSSYYYEFIMTYFKTRCKVFCTFYRDLTWGQTVWKLLKTLSKFDTNRLLYNVHYTIGLSILEAEALNWLCGAVVEKQPAQWKQWFNALWSLAIKWWVLISLHMLV